ncbi:tryptophan 7-halogenase [Bradyrhizobium sp. CB82]|nr:FAD-dependent monooxygenase [Bradyrhizobium sp. CB82]WFU44157.1 tryptophan 7-halogenase [Bradyrhizobium sp. CB82]
MEFAAEHDVVILGAGPAGASAAIRLAQMGLDVGLVERLHFPRSHVGICISDETVALIDYLGLGREFDSAQFWRRHLTAVRWGDQEARLVPQQGYHVDRAVLDELMLRQSRLVGVRIYQPVQVQEVKRLEDFGWGVTIAANARRQRLKARFIVDAAGRRPAISGARIKDGPPLVSIHANWALTGIIAFDGLIEAGEDAWLWYAQTAHNQAVVSVFCDPRSLRASKADGMQAQYAGVLRQFRALRPGQLGEQSSAPQICDATSHHAKDPVGDRYIRLGDACFSVDPLSSQGVHLALQSGLQGSIVVNTILRKPENTEVARQFFFMRTRERIGRYTGRTKQEYARVAAIYPNAFWRARASDASAAMAVGGPDSSVESPPRAASDQVAVSPHVSLGAAPVIDGVFVQVRQVVRHPNIDGDVAYVEGADLARLLSALPQRFAYCDIPSFWRDHVPSATGDRIASWLWSKHVLVRAV